MSIILPIIRSRYRSARTSSTREARNSWTLFRDSLQSFEILTDEADLADEQAGPIIACLGGCEKSLGEPCPSEEPAMSCTRQAKSFSASLSETVQEFAVVGYLENSGSAQIDQGDRVRDPGRAVEGSEKFCVLQE
jgi:hypothetical protein